MNSHRSQGEFPPETRTAPLTDATRRHAAEAPRQWLKALLNGNGWFDRAAIVRHVALSAAAGAAYLFRGTLVARPEILWIIAAALLLNCLILLLPKSTRGLSVARIASSAAGVSGWTLLIYFTGGITSPFAAGLALEVVLAARTFGLNGIAPVTFVATCGLWLQQLRLGLANAVTPLLVQTSMLLLLGGLIFFLARYWSREQRALSDEGERIRRRLLTLEGELAAAPRMEEIGENVARLAHGCKNTIHSLKGFAALIERHLRNDDESARTLAGLRAAIDQLEGLVRSTLLAGGAQGAASGSTDGERLGKLMEETRIESSSAYPQVQWRVLANGGMPAVGVPPEIIKDVLLELCTNAAAAVETAVEAPGCVTLETCAHEAFLCLHVRDEGSGIAEASRSRIFERGFSTKPEGHGLGLFLSRRSLMLHGGALEARPAPHGGALFCMRLPVAGDRSRPPGLPRRAAP
ncbi:MAG: HAMP domain-containing sensor histidine kinase [Deltaproteobacteria bacterium]|nr:HAMP domain-containing sensor histidine kinase [Deltaproteobacteria bacterium]